MTIEERSEIYQEQKHNFAKDYYVPRYLGEAYRDGAKDQQRIDIKKVCKHLEQLGVFKWLAGDEGLSVEAIKDQFILTITEG